MNVSELIGAELDAWVARAEGHTAHRNSFGVCVVSVFANGLSVGSGGKSGVVFAPSTTPAQGQPIMERERIGAAWAPMQEVWCAIATGPAGLPGKHTMFDGPTMLIAGMRARVAQVYGDEVLS